jgi:DNA polymerase delta subunit 1
MSEEESHVRKILTLEVRAHIIGTQVLTFKKEDEMLTVWREFVKLLDPDVFTGYNSINFDFTYLV